MVIQLEDAVKKKCPVGACNHSPNELLVFRQRAKWKSHGNRTALEVEGGGGGQIPG